MVAELPLIEQLVAMQWQHVESRRVAGRYLERDSTRDVLLERRLRAALRKINLGADGEPWLDDARISQMVGALQRPAGRDLLEINQELTALLIGGIEVAPPSGARQRQVRVDYIDWEHPERNDFVVMDQFRVQLPANNRKAIIPDLVLFVNGIPLVVIEAKAGQVTDPLMHAIDQLRRYANRRGDITEGNERLFHTNQLMIGTCFDDARAGTITAAPNHYAQWKTIEPATEDEVSAEVSHATPFSLQEQITAGMLRPERLLDLIRHCTLFTQTDDGQTIKVVARYQQYRAVRRAIERLKTGQPKAPGVDDGRGGIIWHTQGSGKSLTMVFLIKAMRSDPALRSFKVVVITDRAQLQQQLSDTAELADETVEVAKNVKDLKRHLARKGKDLVFAMIQKHRDPDGSTKQEKAAEAAELTKQFADLGELNTDHNILVLVDEAHRSHGSDLHMSLLTALPNCARIGFTGTPIIMGKRKKTLDIFGTYIDRYTIKQSEEDGATVPILYEGRTTRGSVRDHDDLDELFDDMFVERTPEELERIKQRWATKGHVLEAPNLIEAKARNMLAHYVDTILPNRFKAQVVATSRTATVRYRGAFQKAQRELLAQLDSLPPGMRTAKAAEDYALRGGPTARLVRGWRHRDLIARLDFVPVISGQHNDEAELSRWTNKPRQNQAIQDFKKPLPTGGNSDPEKTSPVAFLLVKSMLLTGFDAPVEQVLYLDRHIKEAELLQAIARVNRSRKGKRAGYVIDFFGVANNLRAALAAYARDDLEGVLADIREQIPKLREREHIVRKLFAERGVTSFDTPDDIEKCVQLLEDEKLRTEFEDALKQFAETMEIVLPRLDAKPHIVPFKTFGNIQRQARNRYRDLNGFDVSLYGAKVRQLIDDYVIAHGVDQTIPPVSVTAADFDRKVCAMTNARARASEMEHAIRHHIDQHRDEDPEFYDRLSERLERILQDLKDQAEELVQALWPLVEEARAGRQAGDGEFSPVEAALYDLLRSAVTGLTKDCALDEDRDSAVRAATVDVIFHIRQDIQLVGFWGNTFKQDQLRMRIFDRLVVNVAGDDLFDFDRLEDLSTSVLELARANHSRFTGGR
ncbi:type I restriction endonuclease subunit R [Amycolatopsis panacis]|uniref:Type I restriction enzyme endonuclease subunit n=2 Tax=Amycolatopsis panacis TaxID=2340917 RepID=A0A419HXU4_9PSEU|nr:type I restriction endonuclease subunit R [Amycolatopsis panacis]